MLTLLRISHYAIIDELEIELHPGFSVMTGETGAGKSILVDAMGLALGDRADASAIQAGAKSAEISLVFEVDRGHPATDWLVERGLDDEDLCCLRRTVSVEGRSRAFVNNRPVTLQDLRSLGAMLVDIHGQHEHQSLLSAPAQRHLLDAAGKHADLVDKVAQAFSHWQTQLAELESRAGGGADREAQLELLRFQLAELETLGLEADEPRQLRVERDRLRNIDNLRQAVAQAAELLYESESGSAYSLAARAQSALESVVDFDPELSGLTERIGGAAIELKEAGIELARRVDALDADPERLTEIEERIERIRQLARRHRVDDAEVPLLTDRLRKELDDLDASAESVAALERRAEQAESLYHQRAAELSGARRTAAPKLSRAVTAKLRELGLPQAEFEVSVRPRPESKRDSTGIDQVEFLITTNPGQPKGPISRIASGGELSRVGLALQVVATGASPIPTFVFDEVDAGIGGAVAEVVGKRLREIAAHRQVLCVTHLPQVASQGVNHYRIVKLTDGKTTRTQVRALDPDQRIEELSRMLGGVEITAATRAHAEEMIRQAAGR